MSILHLLKKAGVGAEEGVKRALEATGKPIGAVAAPTLEHAAVTLLTTGLSKGGVEHAAKNIAAALVAHLEAYARQSEETADGWRKVEWRIAADVAAEVSKALG